MERLSSCRASLDKQGMDADVEQVTIFLLDAVQSGNKLPKATCKEAVVEFGAVTISFHHATRAASYVTLNESTVDFSLDVASRGSPGPSADIQYSPGHGKCHLQLATAARKCHTHQEPHSCRFCTEHCDSHQGVRYHIAMDHSEMVVWTATEEADNKGREEDAEGVVSLWAGASHYCSYCTSSYNRRYLLVLHVRREHFEAYFRNRSRQVIDVAEATTSTSGVSEEEVSSNASTDTHHQQEVQCNLCGELWPGQNQLTDHIRRAHRKPLRCSDCTLTFLYRISLAFHARSVHVVPDRSIDIRSHQDANPETSCRDVHSFDCTECDQSFPTRSQFNRHLTNCHPKERWCEFCQSLLSSRSNLRRHHQRIHGTGQLMRPVPSSVPLTCDLCDLEFVSSGRLKHHVMIAHLQIPFQCGLCLKSLKTKDMLTGHESRHVGRFRCAECRSLHGSYRALRKHLPGCCQMEYLCSLCDERFSIKRDYLQHLRHQHKKQNVWFCQICEGKGFVNETLYRHHMERHSGCRKHRCRFCQKSFCDYETLNQHQTVDCDQRVCLCDLCGRGFSSKGALKNHTDQIHEDAQRVQASKTPCEFCGKLFTKYRIKNHLLSHGDKNFQCSICGKWFRTESNLDQHSKSHSDRKPHACPICGITFKFPHHVRNHQRRHTGEPNPYPHRKRKMQPLKAIDGSFSVAKIKRF